jgi:hypothetical protein
VRGTCGYASARSSGSDTDISPTENHPDTALIDTGPTNTDTRPTDADTRPTNTDTRPTDADTRPTNTDTRPTDADTGPAPTDPTARSSPCVGGGHGAYSLREGGAILPSS